MKAVYKWRLKNGVYGYITNEQDESAFIYDQTTFEREYPDGTVISGTSVDEPLIANIVSKKSKSEYIQMFNEFKEFVNIEYPYVAFLDVMYYYNVENDECSTSAGSLKCAGSDILFKVKSVSSGIEPQVTIEPINTDPELGDLRYDMSFVLPVAMVSGGTNVFSALTSNTINVVSSVTAEEFVKNGGTNEQYLMADGSISVLSAGTNVTISTATTTYGKVVTVSSKDTNTWRNVNVNGSQILNNSITSGLTLSAGTNVSLAVTTNGTNKVVTINSSYNDSNTWRNVNVNGTQILDNRIVSGLTLSAGTNVTLTVTESGNNKVVKISSSAGVYENGTNVKIGGDNKINAEGYYFDSGLTNVTLFDTSDSGLKYTGLYGNNGITVNANPVGIITPSDRLIIENKEYKVNDVHGGPYYIMFTTTFDTGTTIDSKIYKITKEKLDQITTGYGTDYNGGFLQIANLSKVYEFSVDDKIRHESNTTFLYTITERVTSGPYGLRTNPEFPTNAPNGVIYKVTTDLDRKNAATAERSFAAGTGTVAYKKSMTVVGEYNDLENNSNKSDILFAVGNGTNAERSNAFIVRKDGSIHIHSTVDPSTTDHYGGRIDFGDGSGEKANVYIEERGDDELKFRSTNYTFTSYDASVFINESANVTATVNGIKNVFLGVPIGSITMWTGNDAPSGWVLCNGYTIQLTTTRRSGATEFRYDGTAFYFTNKNDDKYTELVKVICGGITLNNWKFGISMDSSVHYITLPNLEQKFPLGAKQSGVIGKQGNAHTVTGWGTTLGKTGGTSGQTLGIVEMPRHAHSVMVDTNASGSQQSFTNVYPINQVNGKEDGSLDTNNDCTSTNTIVRYTGGVSSSQIQTDGYVHNNIPPFIALNFIIKYE